MKISRKEMIAIFSIGFLAKFIAIFYQKGIFHADEHYQILEFLSYKHFATPAKDLAWEFSSQIRPWFQVYVYSKIISFFELLGVTSRFTYLNVFRLISVILSTIATFKLFKLVLQNYSEEWQQRWGLLLLNFMWFMPFLSVRTSSETISASILAIAYSYFIDKNYQKKQSVNVFLGILFGVSFLLRFQSAFIVFPLCLWALVYRKKSILDLFNVTFVTFVLIGLGVVVDFWGYGNWTFTAWNYYKANIIDGVAASFGVSPWWRYIYEVQKELYPGIGLFVIISFLFHWLKYFKSSLTWLTLFFFVSMSMVSHKELRFIFPLAYFAPFVILSFSSYLKDKINNLKVLTLLKGLSLGAFVFNLVILILSLFKPIQQSEDLNHFLSLNHSKDETIFYTSAHSPRDIIGIKVNYYGLSDLKAKKIKSLSDLPDKMNNLVFSTSGKDYISLVQSKRCEEIYPLNNSLYFKIYYERKLYKKDYYFLARCNIN